MIEEVPIYPKSSEPTKIINTFFDYALKIFVVLGTLFYLPTPARITDAYQATEFGYASQELFFRYGVIFLYGISMALIPKRQFKFNSGFVLMTFLIFISCFQGFDTQIRRQVLNIFLGLAFYKMVVEHFEIRKIREFAGWFFWLLVANLVLCFFQEFKADPIFRHVNYDIVPVGETMVGFMKLKAHLGTMAAIVSPILLVLSPWLLLISLPLIYYSKASAAALAFTLSLSMVAFLRMNKKVFAVILLVLVLAGGFYILKFDMPTGQFNQRLMMWHRTLAEGLTQGPFFGLSIGSFGRWAPQSAQLTVEEKLTWIWAHNDLLQAFFEMGITGLVIILCFIRGRFRDFKKYSSIKDVQALFGCFVSILVVSFFHFPFHQGKTVGLCLFLMALFHARIAEEEKYEII